MFQQVEELIFEKKENLPENINHKYYPKLTFPLTVLASLICHYSVVISWSHRVHSIFNYQQVQRATVMNATQIIALTYLLNPLLTLTTNRTISALIFSLQLSYSHSILASLCISLHNTIKPFCAVLVKNVYVK